MLEDAFSVRALCNISVFFRTRHFSIVSSRCLELPVLYAFLGQPNYLRGLAIGRPTIHGFIAKRPEGSIQSPSKCRHVLRYDSSGTGTEERLLPTSGASATLDRPPEALRGRHRHHHADPWRGSQSNMGPYTHSHYHGKRPFQDVGESGHDFI